MTDTTNAITGDTEGSTAEATILVLGSVLKWENHSEAAFTSEYFRARIDGTFYDVWDDTDSGREADANFERPYMAATRTEEQNPTFLSLPAAKAACERQHVTGEWE